MTSLEAKETAEDLNRRLRSERSDEPPGTGEPGRAGYAQEQFRAGAVPTHRDRLAESWMLPDVPTVADLPGIGRMSRVPVVGGVLAFCREIYGGLWLLTHRRAPIAQQMRFNRAVADALALLDVELLLDRDLQALKKEVYALDARAALGPEQLESRLTALAAQVQRLGDEVRDLKATVEHARNLMED